MFATNGKFKQLRLLVCVVLNHIITYLTPSFLLFTHVFGAVAQGAWNEGTAREAQGRAGRTTVAQRGNERRERSERGNGGSETSQRQEGNAGTGTDDELTTAIRDAASHNAARAGLQGDASYRYNWLRYQRFVDEKRRAGVIPPGPKYLTRRNVDY